MLERMIVKHWIALTVGFTLLGVLIRVIQHAGAFCNRRRMVSTGIYAFSGMAHKDDERSAD